MRRAKLVLAAIAIIAIVSGASAFRAKNAYQVTIYTGTSAVSCPTKTFARTGITGDFQVYYSTQPGSSSCTLAWTSADN